MEKASRIMMMDAGFRAQRADNEATQAELWETIAQLQAEVDRLKVANRTLTVQAADAKGRLALQEAHNEGLFAQGKVIKGELVRIAPKSEILAQIGVYTDGTIRTRAHLAYEAAFDEKFKKAGFTANPAAYRPHQK